MTVLMRACRGVSNSVGWVLSWAPSVVAMSRVTDSSSLALLYKRRFHSLRKSIAITVLAGTYISGIQDLSMGEVKQTTAM